MPVADLASRFVTSFQKAIREEMEAMRQRLGAFEVVLAQGQELEQRQDGMRRYAFDALERNDKLVANTECSLRCGAVEHLVTLESVSDTRVTLTCQNLLDLMAQPMVLVIYPWFLYERLIDSLERLVREQQRYCVESALRAFGKLPAVRVDAGTPVEMPDALNESQKEALQLCAEGRLAFVWGPPGTGKTTTLAAIVEMLHRAGHRILITSTTNAAVDQALAALHRGGWLDDVQSDGTVLRLGVTEADTHGASMREMLSRRHEQLQQALEELYGTIAFRMACIERCRTYLTQLEDSKEPEQQDLFGEAAGGPPPTSELLGAFPRARLDSLAALRPDLAGEAVSRRLSRLELALSLTRARIADSEARVRRGESAIMAEARVVMATMTNVYLHPLMQGELFDVVIIEEAGMAILPTLFFCASLSENKVILVGDPRQLPPIVQSRSEYVARAMGRNIFDVTVPDPSDSPHVAMLDLQYRMHPAIGSLVSDLFYGGTLRNGLGPRVRTADTARAPFPGKPLVLYDTGGRSSCEVREASFSRFSHENARICTALALEALDAGMQGVAIITPYVAQSRLIRDLLRDSRADMDRVTAHTVHRFQGNERDMVILDTVDTTPFRPGVLLTGAPGVSAAANLINVSISRARAKLVVVADVAYFRQEASGSVMRRMLDAMRERGSVVTE